VSSTPLNLAPLREMAANGFNVAVLALLEHRAMQRAITERELAGYTAHPGDEVRRHATEVLPKDALLFQAYSDTQASLRRQPVQDLEDVGRSLSLCALHLERAAARTLATTKDLPLAAKVEPHRVMAQRYAELLEATRTLEASGVVTVTGLQDRLASLSARPGGPLEEFYDAATELCAQRQGNAADRPRMRMAA
jgi:hypothetical protein